MDRRRFLRGVALTPVAATVPAPALAPPSALPFSLPPGGRLLFDVRHDLRPIGQHSVTLTRTEDGMTASVATEWVVSTGPIASLRYRHRATLQWNGGQITAISSETNSDGTPRHMTARRDNNGLIVEGSGTDRYVAPPRAEADTYWTRSLLDPPFISTQDGRLMRPTVTPLGPERLDIAGGVLEARHYALRGDVDLDTWYDTSSTLAGLRLTAKDGSDIRFVRVQSWGDIK